MAQIENIATICRFCLKPGYNTSLKDIFVDNSKVALQASTFFGVELRPFINIPSLVCLTCENFLEDIEKFGQKLWEADGHLRNLDYQENPLCLEDIVKVKEEKEDNLIEYRVYTYSQEEEQKFQTNQNPQASRTPYKNIPNRKPKDIQKPSTSTVDVNPPPPLICDTCGKSFKNKLAISNHLRKNHEKRTIFPCSFCGKVLPHGKALYAHERSHIKSEVVCQYCSKVFARQVLLTAHITIVHEKKQLTLCPHCPHQSVTHGALKKHIRCKHLDLRNHHCTWPGCERKFHENQHLVRHFRSHTNERPYQCRNEGCEKCFSDHSKRSRHEKRNCPRRVVVA